MNLSDVFKNHPLPDITGLSPQAVLKLARESVQFPWTAVKERPSGVPSLKCPVCKAELSFENPLFKEWRVCDFCQNHLVMGAKERLEALVDPGTFRPINRAIHPVDFIGFMDGQSYAQKLLETQQKTGLTDAVLAGQCKIGGSKVVLAVLDFNFLGGSLSSVVGEQITNAFEYALRHELPIITVSNSGGARMQEGIVSLMQLAKTAAAVERLKEAGLFYLSVLASPTTGGVFASFASLGDMIVAEPKALIGFAGPRVVEMTTGKKLPAESHTAEFQIKHGLIDAVIPRQEIKGFITELLQLVVGETAETKQVPPSLKKKEIKAQNEVTPEGTPWETLQIARHPDRPTSLDYIRRLSPRFIELNGDQLFGDDQAIVAGLGEIGGRKVVLIGLERGHKITPETEESWEDHHQGKARPEGYRKALRAAELAARLKWPVITFVDTPGADPGVESEERGLASSLAHCFSRFSSLPVPVVATIIGEGGSGGALALAVADRVLMLQNASYEVIAPEGAAAILYRDASRAEDVAPLLKITSSECLSLGVVDGIISEPEGGAHNDLDLAARFLETAILQALSKLEKKPIKKLLDRRYEKYRKMGQYEKDTMLLLTLVEKMPRPSIPFRLRHLPGHSLKPASVE